MVEGDLNVVRNVEEKLGGLPVTIEETNNLNHCISTCNLEKDSVKCNRFTFWNGKQMRIISLRDWIKYW